MKSDVTRWDKKYTHHHPDFLPDSLLTEHQDLLTGVGAAAIDVACGVGQNAIFLARRGYITFAVDASVVGLCRGVELINRERLTVFPFVADLDQYRLPACTFQVIAVFRYLNRALIPNLKQALVPEGLIFYKTFNRNFLAQHPKFNPAYTVRPGELSEMFADFECCATNDTDDLAEPQTYWIGRKR